MGSLTKLFESTRDAMVAFELAHLHEHSGQNEEATRWYTTAGARFRRAEWKKKAEDALARLGARPDELRVLTSPPPVAAAEQVVRPAPSTALPSASLRASRAGTAGSGQGEELREAAIVLGPAPPPTPSGQAVRGQVTGVERPKRRRRGRRGGRGHRRGASAALPSALRDGAQMSRRAGGGAVPTVPKLREGQAGSGQVSEAVPTAGGSISPPPAAESAALRQEAWQLRARAG